MRFLEGIGGIVICSLIAVGIYYVAQWALRKNSTGGKRK
jgi:hypothetical protein